VREGKGRSRHRFRARRLAGLERGADVEVEVEGARLSIALTDFKVAITGKAFTVKIKGKKVKKGFLEATGCGELPVRAIAHFKDSSTGQTTDVTNDSKTKAC
jgi:hypothetical protein